MTRLEYFMQKINAILDGNNDENVNISYKEYFKKEKESRNLNKPYNRDNIYTAIFPNQDIMNIAKNTKSLKLTRKVTIQKSGK